MKKTIIQEEDKLAEIERVINKRSRASLKSIKDGYKSSIAQYLKLKKLEIPLGEDLTMFLEVFEICFNEDKVSYDFDEYEENAVDIRSGNKDFNLLLKENAFHGFLELPPKMVKVIEKTKKEFVKEANTFYKELLADALEAGYTAVELQESF